MIALLCLGHAAEPTVPGAGLYLKAFDFEAAHDDRALAGSGRATFTADIAEAKRFADLVEVHAFYRTVPKCCPVRWWSDGEPNRPATGYHWQIVSVHE
jgi:hypothetical protein